MSKVSSILIDMNIYYFCKGISACQTTTYRENDCLYDSITGNIFFRIVDNRPIVLEELIGNEKIMLEIFNTLKIEETNESATEYHSGIFAQMDRDRKLENLLS